MAPWTNPKKRPPTTASHEKGIHFPIPPEMVQVMTLCRKPDGWVVDEQVKRIIVDDFGGISQTKAVEDGVRVCKTALINRARRCQVLGGTHPV